MTEKRQIVFIMTDTQRWDMVGCYGNKDMITPNLDKLAEDGIRFEKAYTCQPVCGPARSAIFTGTFPHSNGSWGNTMPLGDNVKTIGQRLTDRGINTGYIGKWHLDGGDYFGNGVCPDGWDPDYWYDMRCYLDELSHEDRIRSRDARIIKEDPSEEFTFGHRCSNRAIDFVEKNKDNDYFLAVSYDEPHHPFVCPKKYYDMYDGYSLPDNDNFRDKLENKPDYQVAWAEGRQLQDKTGKKFGNQELFACNSFVDSEIGRVVDAVRKSAPDAMIIYTSDHGDFIGSHSLSAKGPAVYDEIVRIPFIVSWPNIAPRETVCDIPASHIDIVPTIMDYFDIKRYPVIEGESMIDTLKNPEVKKDKKVFIEFGRYEIDHDSFGAFQPMRSCFNGRYKLSINLLSTDELYDMENDPSELNNLINSEEHKGIRNELHDAILKWMNDTRDPFRGYYWERRPWRKDACEATWDYTGMTRQRVEDPMYETWQLDYSTGVDMENPVRKK